MDYNDSELDGNFPMFAFSRNNLNRHALRRSDRKWLEGCRLSKRAVFIIFSQDKVVAGKGRNGGAVFHKREVLNGLKCDLEETVYLGEGDGIQYFAANSGLQEDELERSDSFNSANLRALAIEAAVSSLELGILAQASALSHWHRTHQFCSRCGQPTEMVESGYRRDCPSCGGQHFPRTDPAVIMLVVQKDRCILGSTGRFAEGMYSTLAGFVEPGETLESATRREIMEEAGIEIGRVSFKANQPWPFPANLMLGCFAEALSDKITIDPNELTDCRWFEREEVMLMSKGEHPDKLFIPPRISIASALITHWLEIW